MHVFKAASQVHRRHFLSLNRFRQPKKPGEIQNHGRQEEGTIRGSETDHGTGEDVTFKIKLQVHYEDPQNRLTITY